MQKSPVDDAGFFSRYFFWWASPIMRKGFREKLRPSDVCQAPSEDMADVLAERLETEWDREVVSAKQKPSLLRALSRCFIRPFLLFGILLYLGEATKAVQPQLLGRIIASFDPFHEPEREQGYFLALGLGLLFIARFLLLQPAMFGLHHLGMQVRIALFSLIYKKTLKLSSRVLDKISTGQLVSLMSANLNKFDQSLGMAHYVWISPLQCILCVGLIWELIDVNSFGALAAISLLGVIQACLSHKMGPYKAQRVLLTNKRLALTSEIMENLHSVKAYGWEEIMETIINKIRQDEVDLTRKIGSLRYFYSSAYFFSAIWVITAAVLPVALTSGITVRRVFTTLSYCMVLRMTVTRQLPASIQMWYDTIRLIRKIEDFLSKEEYKMMEYDLSITDMRLENVTASWDEGIGGLFEKIKQENKGSGYPNGDGLFFTNLYVTPVLKNISLHLKKGEMLAVAGSTGSGKSSLLMAILGELVPSSGKIRHSGRVSFSSQTAWIVPGTIRDNILFGLTYDEYRYSSVVKACQLEEDLSALPEKDRTPLAEGGLNLSGGQKARVALARAVYRDADTYLLDAPFTHLDIATEKEIFDKCLCVLMASRTRVVVTNKIEHLKRAHKILLLHGGECFFYGTFQELQCRRPDFSSLLLGLEAYDSVSADRRCSILTETLRRVSVDESPATQPDRPSFRQVAPPTYKDERKPSTIVGPLAADRKASFRAALEDEVATVRRSLPGRKISLVPESELVDECFIGGDNYHNHGVHMAGQRRQSVLAFMTNVQGLGRREQIQSSFRRRLSIVPQGELASELDIYARRLSKDSTYDITGDMEEQNIEDCFADEQMEDVFETTKWNTYVRYVSTNRSLVYVLIFILVIYAIEVAGSVAGIFLITDEIWNEEHDRLDPNVTKQANVTPPGTTLSITIRPSSSYYIVYIYVATSESILALGFFRGLPLVHTMITISKKLHQKMLNSVLRAPMSVLNIMKTGRIMNRFTKDMATIDDMLPLLMFDLVQLTLVVVGCILVVSIMRPYIFLAATPLALIFVVLRKYFLRTGQQLKQMETEARSPIFSHLIISLKGLWTIRAFDRQAYFETLFHKALNTHTAVWFLYLSTLRWFLFRADIIYVFFFTAAAWIAVGTNQDKPGEIGIIVALAMLILGTFQWCVVTSIAVDGMMRSVERVFKFIDLPSEEPRARLGKGKSADLVIANTDACKEGSWPCRGQLDVRNLTVKYTEAGHAVLKNLSFTVEGSQKVGILGRSGSGKSTLFNALLRLAYTDGDMTIDGVSHSTMALQRWRKAFGVVPQKVFIFTGTFRMNLDPCGFHSDEELWRVAEEVGLKSVIEQFPDKLDFQLEYGGHMLSYGHKQLMCLARSVLSRARILLLDEPSAHLDPLTVKVLKKTLRQSFSACTILLCEHKVEPLLECQRFLMMEQGKVKTYESIQRLLNETSQLKQAISPAEHLKLFPRRNSSMRVPQPKLSSVTLPLQEEAEDDGQDTRL
ncbi:cystic fibrosis transmembrane conductance regulator [Brachyhypopomus gauderio]|uniref:cystic fibrosis transmembrane conductance regulator n=1 Tax=Brachyhypopomus gauderio TaxID=698409 RepID=UPI004041D80C